MVNRVSAKNRYCYIPKCKAICCASAPIPEKLYHILKPKEVRKTIIPFIAPQNNHYCKDAIVTITSLKALEYAGKMPDGHNMWKVNLYAADNYCAFLKKNYKCNIYDNRPPICRDFGSKKDLPCPHQISKSRLILYKSSNFIKKTINRVAMLFF